MSTVDIPVDRNNVTGRDDVEAEVLAEALSAARKSFRGGADLEVVSGFLMWDGGDEPHTMRLKGVLAIGERH